MTCANHRIIYETSHCLGAHLETFYKGILEVGPPLHHVRCVIRRGTLPSILQLAVCNCVSKIRISRFSRVRRVEPPKFQNCQSHILLLFHSVSLDDHASAVILTRHLAISNADIKYSFLSSQIVFNRLDIVCQLGTRRLGFAIDMSLTK